MSAPLASHPAVAANQSSSSATICAESVFFIFFKWLPHKTTRTCAALDKKACIIASNDKFRRWLINTWSYSSSHRKWLFSGLNGLKIALFLSVVWCGMYINITYMTITVSPPIHDSLRTLLSLILTLNGQKHSSTVTPPLTTFLCPKLSSQATDNQGQTNLHNYW